MQLWKYVVPRIMSVLDEVAKEGNPQPATGV